MKKLDRLISWLDRFGFSEEAEILKEAGRGEAKLMSGSNFNLALEEVEEELKKSKKKDLSEDDLDIFDEELKDLSEDDLDIFDEELDIKDRVIKLMGNRMLEGDKNYFSKDDISNVGGYEEPLQNLNKIERLAYYLSDLYLGRKKIEVPDGYEVDEVIKEYLFSGRFHQPGIMSKRLEFITPMINLKISPNDYRTNSKKLLKDFELYIKELPKKEMKKNEEADFLDRIEKVKIYSDGDYIAYIPGDKRSSEDGNKCFSELRSKIGFRMGNCLGNLQYHHCDHEKIYIYFSKDNKPYIMINIQGQELIEIEANQKGYNYQEKHFDRLKDFIFSNTNVASIENSNSLIEFFEGFAEDVADEVWEYYFKDNIGNLISKYQEMDAEDYINKVFAHLKLYANSITVSDPIADPAKFNSVEIFDQARFDSMYKYIDEGKGEGFDYKIGPLIILSNAFLLNPSKENFLKIKNKLNMMVFNEFKESGTFQYKGISWLLKMIFLTEEGEYEKLESSIKKYAEISEMYSDEPSKFKFSLIIENDDSYNDKGNSYFDQPFENYRFQINCGESDAGDNKFRPFDDDHTCYSLKLSIIPSDFRMKRRF